PPGLSPHKVHLSLILKKKPLQFFSDGPYDALWSAAAYVQVAVGFLAMLVSVCWTVCRQGAKSRLYLRGERGGRERGGRGRGGRHRHLQIYTIDRPFPPSYEESQRSHADPDSVEMVNEGVPDSMGMAALAVVVEEVEGGPPTLTMAPPLYTEHSSDVPDCTWAWEQPPPYMGPAPTS
ncbi:hypothetical protein CRUP_017870, partial [Coryphaenoides rupestris]